VYAKVNVCPADESCVLVSPADESFVPVSTSGAPLIGARSGPEVASRSAVGTPGFAPDPESSIAPAEYPREVLSGEELSGGALSGIRAGLPDVCGGSVDATATPGTTTVAARTASATASSRDPVSLRP
jgi:hypothetical protein